MSLSCVQCSVYVIKNRNMPLSYYQCIFSSWSLAPTRTAARRDPANNQESGRPWRRGRRCGWQRRWVRTASLSSPRQQTTPAFPLGLHCFSTCFLLPDRSVKAVVLTGDGEAYPHSSNPQQGWRAPAVDFAVSLLFFISVYLLLNFYLKKSIYIICRFKTLLGTLEDNSVEVSTSIRSHMFIGLISGWPTAFDFLIFFFHLTHSAQGRRRHVASARHY